MQVVGESKETGRQKISFLADAEIFEETVYDATTLLLALTARWRSDARLRFPSPTERARAGKPASPLRGGIRDFVGYINETKDIVHSTSCTRWIERPGRGRGGDAVERVYQESVFSFATTSTRTRAFHLSGFARRSRRRSTVRARPRAS